jgi:hypothetical protein
MQITRRAGTSCLWQLGGKPGVAEDPVAQKALGVQDRMLLHQGNASSIVSPESRI